MIPREIESHIRQLLFGGKTILVLGPRQSGKTTLLNSIAGTFEGKSNILMFNADNAEDRELMNNINSSRARQLFQPGSLVLVDEAQRLENTGLCLKIIHDSCPGIQLIATGSSAFELNDRIREPLTGRKWSFSLYPISMRELVTHSGVPDVIRLLDIRLVYGCYPDVINNAGMERRILDELVSDYLFKDVFRLKDLRKPDVLEKLVRALALQTGSQVSYRELSGLLQIDKETVERYIRLLEEAYVIFRLPSYSSNLREELKHSRKIYFTDNGVRNALIHNFQPLELRTDAGALWENFLISERRKNNHNRGRHATMYFWRTTRQQEIDLIEEEDGTIRAYEFKWGRLARKGSLPRTFIDAYPRAEVSMVDRENYWEFLGMSGDQ